MFVTVPLFFQMPILFAVVFSSFRLILSAFGWEQVEYHTELMNTGLWIQYWLYGLCVFVFRLQCTSPQRLQRESSGLCQGQNEGIPLFCLGSHMTVINSETFANYFQFYNKNCSNGKCHLKSKILSVFTFSHVFPNHFFISKSMTNINEWHI